VTGAITMDGRVLDVTNTDHKFKAIKGWATRFYYPRGQQSYFEGKVPANERGGGKVVPVDSMAALVNDMVEGASCCVYTIRGGMLPWACGGDMDAACPAGWKRRNPVALDDFDRGMLYIPMWWACVDGAWTLLQIEACAVPGSGKVRPWVTRMFDCLFLPRCGA
jgi:hypothetical protein